MGRLGASTTGWWSVGLLLAAVAHAHAIPKHYTGDVNNPTNVQHSSNDVYPTTDLRTLDEQAFELALVRNMSQVTDLREFIMKYVQDERICFSSSIRQLVLGREETDIRANIWWSKRCGGRSGKPVLTPPVMSESTLIRYRRKSSNRANHKNTPDPSQKDKDKLNKLIKNKKIQCNAKKAVVELPNDERHLVTLWPSCVYIKQCSGCCSSHLLQCRPIKTKNKKFKVVALQKGQARMRRFADPQLLRTIVVAEHKKCECQCKVQPEHCTSSQRYNQDACSCYCPTESHKTCSNGKVWSEKECDCVCRDVSECTTGRFFDNDSCRCADPPVN